MAANTNVEVRYNSNEIQLKVGKKILTLFSQEKKELKGSEIIETLDYKKGKKYLLKELDYSNDISEEYLKYLNESYNLIKGILDKIK